MIYEFEIMSRRLSATAEVELSEEEVASLKEYEEAEGVDCFYALEDYDSDLYEKILDACNEAFEVVAKEDAKEWAKECDEDFDEDKFEVDWANLDVDVILPDLLD